jgi:hypothetical protein
MRHISKYGAIIFLLFLTETICQSTPAQTSALTKPEPISTESIIRNFCMNEKQVRQAIENFSYRREVVIQTIGQGGQITGEYYRYSHFLLNDLNEKYEKIISHPMPSIRELGITAEDLEDIAEMQSFGIDVSKLDQYRFSYVGKERIDELDLYVFDVEPKTIPNPKKSKERVFKGRIWVDDRDLQIVKVRGKAIPEGKQKYPTFETYRENIEGRYWFPSYIYIDEELVFDNGRVVHVRSRVRYKDYERTKNKNNSRSKWNNHVIRSISYFGIIMVRR